jgi:hypothetical protein
MIMTIDLSTIKATKRILPPRITIYGPEKVGKSTFLAQVPGVFIADVEAGTGALEVARVMRDSETGTLTTYESFLEVIDALETQDHSYEAFGIDTADWLENLLFQAAAKEHKKKTVADVDYGAGYVTAENMFRDLLRRLDGLRKSRNMPIIFLAHSTVERFDNPLSASYDQYRLKLHKRISPLLNEWSDCLMFANVDVSVKKEQIGMSKVNKTVDQGRVLYTGKSEAHVSGNRYGLPPVLPLEWAAFIDAFNEATK